MKRLLLILTFLLATSSAFGAVNFQAVSAIAASTGADVTVTLPAQVSGDIFLLQVIVRDVDDTLTVTGWTQLGTVDRGTTARYWWYWIRSDGATADPLVDKNTATGDTYALVTSYRGALATGDPWETKGTPATGTADPTTLATISSVTAGALIVASVSGEDNNNASIVTTGTDPSAYTEVYDESTTGADGVTTVSYANRTTAGATGTVSIDWNTAVPVGTGGMLLSLAAATATGVDWYGNTGFF